MSDKIDKRWHLAIDDDEVKVTEFEFQLWRVFYGFLRWQEDCYQYVCHETLSGHELAILHIIRMNDRPKTIYDISRLLNRDDPNNVQYGLGKLIKIGLIEKNKSKTSQKSLSYQITPKGIEHTDASAKARSDVLVELFKAEGFDRLDIEKITKSLSTIKGLYEEAARLIAAYKR